MMAKLSWRAMAAIAVLALTMTALADQARGEGWGTIKGQVVYGGKDVPKRVEANVDKDKAHCLSKGPIHVDEIVIDPKSKGVRWTLVWLVDAKDPKKSIPVHPSLKEIKGPVTIDQPCCVFEPRVIALREGQDLVVKNSAPVAHNVKIDGGALGPNINPLMPPNSETSVKDVKARLLPIQYSCSIHPWMKGWIGVYKHPYYAVTDKDGNFEIKNAPAGNFRLMVWQEKVGWVIINPDNPRDRGRVIKIEDKETTNVGKIELKE